MEPQSQGAQSPNQDSIISPNYNEMTEAERQADFRRKHQEYIAIKKARKEQLARLIRQQIGPSSSDSDDEDLPRSQSSDSCVKQPMEQSTKAIPQTLQKVKSQNQKSKQEVILPISVKKGNEWVKQTLLWRENNSLVIDSYGYEIKTISKLKIMSEPCTGCNFRIKMSYHQSEVIYGVPDAPQRQQLPLPYYMFSKIIKQRLKVAGFTLKNRTIEKIPGLPETLIKNAFIYGKIYKKSQVLGKWDERFVVINKDGIFSYKSFNQKYSMKIQPQNIKQFWTRFEVQDDMLIFKTWYNSKKTQFGFPMYECINTNNWLYHFYKMMIKSK